MKIESEVVGYIIRAIMTWIMLIMAYNLVKDKTIQKLCHDKQYDFYEIRSDK